MSGWGCRRMEQRGESPAQALPPPQAPLGLLRCTEPFSFHCTVGPPDTAVLCTLGTPPHPTTTTTLLRPPSFVQAFPGYLFLSVCLLSSSSPHYLSPPLSSSFPGASLLSRAGEQTGHRELLSRRRHLIQCGTTWLITNPILGPLCVSRVGSVLLSHFIKAITSHFLFCLLVNVLSDT